MIYLLIVFVNLFSLFSSISFVQSSSCIQRTYGIDKLVCVCNETKCDNDPIPTLPKFGEYLHIASTKAGLRFNTTTKKFSATFTQKATATLTINRKIKYQSISGYGAALTDSAAVNILSLSEATQQHILQSYFTPNGLNIRYVRIPIAVTDFSTRKYYYDEVDGDIDLIYFNLTKEDYDYKIPLIKRFKQISTKQLRFIAAAWSSPEWMKNYPQDKMSSVNETYYQTWANYHLKFLQAYDMEGINFFALTTGNDPLISKIVNENSSVMLPWEPELQSKWLAENLGPTLKNNGYADVNIFIVDDTTLTFEKYIEKFLKNQEATKYIYGIAVHWYQDFQIPYSLLDTIKMQHPNYTIINTEASWGIRLKDPVNLGDWFRGEAYVQDIILDMNNGISAWLEWNMALDVQGGPSFVGRKLDSLIIVNATADEFYKEPMFYAVGHFSRFILEQSIRINSTIRSNEFGNNLAALTVERPDGYTVIVALNRAETDIKMIINDTEISIEVLLPKNSFNSIIYKHDEIYIGCSPGNETSTGNRKKPLLQYTMFALSICSLYIFSCFF